jgi:DNA-binding transcriptional LysR family regulator
MPIRHATLHQLKIFDTLVRYMSVVRTAEAMHLTPPAVSIQVKQLSEAAGQPLLEKVGKQVYLTSAGEVVAQACNDLFERLERLSQDLAALQGMEKGSLKLAIITTAKYFVPRLLGDFCARYPGIDVSLFVGNRQAVLERLARNQDDLYVLGRPPEKAKVNAVPFASNPLVAIAYPDHALAKERAITPERLVKEPFIARELGSGTRLAYEAFFRDYQAELNIRMELGSNEAIKQTVAGRLGISILSQSAVRSELASGEIVQLDVVGLPLQRQWYLARPSDKLSMPAADTFHNFLIARGDL